jgi:pimeloyl-ACP methyl ester carboxylesterase
LDYVLANDPEHAPMNPSQSWMDRINVAQLEIGRDRWQAMSAFSSFDILPTLARVGCPLLVLYGEKFIYGKHRDLMQKHAPKAKIEIVPNGRFCMTWERAEDIAAHARHFLRT